MNILHCIRQNAPRAVSKAAPRDESAIWKRTTVDQMLTSRSPQENEVFTLAEGQKIGYSIHGPLKASALFFFNGQGSSRLQNLDEPANVVGLRIICPDRPGIGLSTFVPGRKLLDYPTQIAQLATHLGLESHRVAGGSGGGPYALGMHNSLYSQFVTAVLHTRQVVLLPASPCTSNFPVSDLQRTPKVSRTERSLIDAKSVRIYSTQKSTERRCRRRRGGTS